MVVVNWILYLFSILFLGGGIFVIFCCMVGISQQKDIFIRMHAIKISNIYGINFLLLSEVINSDSFSIAFQLIVVIIINIISTLAIIHVISRWVMNKGIETTSINRRKYNEQQTTK